MGGGAWRVLVQHGEGGGSGWLVEARQRWMQATVGTGEGWGADRRAQGYSARFDLIQTQSNPFK
jgi:hypothetical protein